MPVVINGTTGISGVDGSAGTPSYVGGDSDTGLWYPAANTLALSTGGSERMRIDSSGNVGIGSTSPLSKLEVVGGQFRVANTSTAAVCIINTDSTSTNGVTVESSYYGGAGYGPMKFNTGGSERMRIDSSGNVGIGTSSPSYPLQVSAGSSGAIAFMVNPTALTNFAVIPSNSGTTGTRIGTTGADTLAFITNNSECMRINSGGNVTVGNSGSLGAFAVKRADGGANLVYFENTSATGYGITVLINNNSSGTYRYFEGVDNGPTQRIAIYTNGDVKNTNNSYGSLSDIKLKQDIVDAASQWNDIKGLRVRKYRFKDKPNDPLQIGLIAQEVEPISAGLIQESPDEIRDEDGNITFTGETTKSIKYSVLYMKAIKALQEAMERIETLEAKVAALEK